VTASAGAPLETTNAIQRELRQLLHERRPLIHWEADLVRDLINGIATAKQRIYVFRAIRNERLAHTDFARALNRGASPMPKTSRDEIEAALDSVFKVLNRAAIGFGETPTDYRLNVEVRGTAALLYSLRLADAQRRSLAREGGNELHANQLTRGVAS
jgi:hypothetical protein